MIEIGYLAAFLGGVVTLLSPCGALLLPSFFAYAFDRPGLLLRQTAVFYAGLVAVMVPLGTSAALASRLVLANQDRLVVGAGWVLILLGTVMASGLAARLPLPAARLRARMEGRTSTGAVFGLGAVYGVAGGCAGPVLGAVLTIAALDGRPVYGAALLAVYSLGMAAPLFLLAGAWERLDPGRRQGLRGRYVRLGPVRLHVTSLLAGGLFTAIGAWLVLTAGAGGIPWLPDTTEVDLAVQGWLLRLDRMIPDRVVLTLLAGAALLVLGWRVRGAWRDRSERVSRSARG